jgi:integrase
MKGSTYKRCGCRDAQDKRLGSQCPKLRRGGGGWNPTHGVWHYQIELPARANGTRRPLRTGGYRSQNDAEADLGKVREALAVPDPADTGDLTKVADLIESTVKAGNQVPTLEQVRRLLRLDQTPDAVPTVEVWLTTWLKGRKTLRQGTSRSYASHLKLHLIPHLGEIRLDRLRVGHINAMFDELAERNEHILALRTSDDPAQRRQAKGLRTLAPATMHRIRATLRAALTGAIRHRWIDFNPAQHIELPPHKRPKALVWTTDRVRRWRATGNVPSPVMVWTPEQTGAFLDHIHDAEDRLYALYHVIAYRGLRRGEACGLHWEDVDLEGKSLTVRWQLTQHGWATQLEAPKTDDSEAPVALDDATVAAFRTHRTRQRREQLAAGPAWADTGLVFTTETGTSLHPADVTDHFRDLTAQAGLPPIRLHDLRHGAATLALAAGVDLKTVQEMLRHSSITITADTYTSVLPELAKQAAEKAAAIVPRRRRTA